MLNINNTLESYLQNVEIKGNTIQNPNNLSDIKSVGDKIDDQEVYRIPIVCTNGLDKSSSDYKEHKITILSPTPIEKVGNVTDRIIEKDGVWGVEKNIITTILNSNVHQRCDIVKNGFRRWYNPLEKDFTDIDLNKNTPNGFCDKLPVITDTESDNPTREGIVLNGGSDNWRFMLITVNSIDSTVKLNTYLSENPLTIKYPTTKPQFIPLPNSQQVKLRTFANKTNISFLTEVEGTIKADVAKSISASVNSNTQEIGKINNRILDLEGLKESQEMTYETDKGYLVCKETKTGTVKDMKIYGKSLLLNSENVEVLPGVEGVTIKSVGTGADRIEVSTNNANLFNEEHWMQDKDGTHTYDGKDLTVSGVWFTKYNIDYIPVNTKFVVCGDAVAQDTTQASVAVFYKDGTNRSAFMTDGYAVFDSKAGVKELNFYASRGTQNTITYENVGIFIGDEKPNFVIPKQDKKPLLFKDVDDSWKLIKELRSCPECADSVELSNDGKYYYYIRTEKRLYTPEDENNPKVITDKTNTIAKLAKEKVFEVNPLFLEAYENETMILCESGAVKPGMEWKITSYITNLVSTNTKRIKRIENDFYNYTVSQNRMMLSSRYNADRADFRIDNTLGVPKTVSVELDYDLFELMKKVVIIGKDNYDRSKIEEQMDFYVTEGFIDWDMWDELFAIIELQHNPPVDLIPIEPISIEEPKPKKSRRGRKKKVEEI